MRGVQAVLVMLLLLGACSRVHFRFHDYEPLALELAGAGVVEVALSGTFVSEDSAGVLIDRRTNPYLLRVYLDSLTARRVDQLSIELIGAETGVILRPDLSELHPLGEDSTRGFYAEAASLELPYDQYGVTIRARLRDQSSSDALAAAGTLRRNFRQSSSFRLWERLMSV